MTVRPICISYPKSGRTWLRMILDSLDVELDYSHLDTGAERKSWGKRFGELGIPKVERQKIVFLYRDPRDVVVSMFHEFTKRQLPILAAEQRQKYQAKGLIPPLNMAEFVQSPRFGIIKTIIFNQMCRKHLNAFELTYEDMVANTYESIKSLLNYLNIQKADDEINKAINENDFASMRRRELTGDKPSISARYLGFERLPAFLPIFTILSNQIFRCVNRQ
jgi:hypothetical protein